MVYVYLDIYFVGTVVDNIAAEVQQENVPAENVATDNGPLTDAVIRVPNPNYGSSASTQPRYMEFIPTPGFPKH